MVPTRFHWPYGGRQVLLSGSFTGWTEHLLMTPVEGSTTVFQRVCNLPPGYYQFKFLVDGVWRVDEQQQYMTDESGVANNIIFVEDPAVVHPIIRHEDPSSSRLSIMDVDNGIFQPLASVSGGIPPEMALQISDDEVNVSRHRLSVLLSRYTAYELLPESGKVFALEVKVPVKQAFHIMYEQGLSVIPIWDDYRRQLCGMLTASDFILILSELHNNGPLLTNEELEMHSISAWKEGKHQISRGSNRPVRLSYGRPLIQVDPHESLKDVVLKILHNKISTVPIIHSAQDTSCPQLLHLACLSGILKYICRHFTNSPGSVPLLQQPIGLLPFGTWVPDIGRADESQLTLLRPSAPLSSALSLLIEAQVSCIPIVDENGSLLDVYSRSDITSLAKGNAYTRIQLDQTSMHQALQLGYEANGAIYALRRCQTCLRSNSLHDVMERLSDPAVRRLIVIEPGSKRVEGIISLSDIFNFLVA